eukprot:scaffold39470_cov20-Tisochrysis_lutea.AAC.2
MQLSTGSLYKLNKDIPFPKPIFLQLMGKKEGAAHSTALGSSQAKEAPSWQAAAILAEQEQDRCVWQEEILGVEHSPVLTSQLLF